jgi:Nuclease-related domain
MALLAAVLVAGAGDWTLAVTLSLLSGVLAWASRRALRLSARSGVGAASEAQVRRTLEPLRSEGWRVQHALNWPGIGDLDHLIRSPEGTGFLIETKTRRYIPAHVRRAVVAASWLARRRRRYPAGVWPVICIVRARSVEESHGGVLIVSADRLLPALRAARSSRSRPCS